MPRANGIVRHFAFAMGIALALYIIVFSWIQHRREFRGPWIVTFQTDTAGQPSLLVTEPKLRISETITFPGQKVSTPSIHQIVTFDEAVASVPFGTMLFQDPTFLPGTVTMSLFGHEVELLPRVLIIDKKETAWRNGAIIQL